MMKMATIINVKTRANFITGKQNTHILGFRVFFKTVHRTENTSAAIVPHVSVR